ncbi:hypothetical protein PHAVU_006G116700 [Phaseolus vulgaris]
MDLASKLRGMLADVEAKEAAQNSKGYVKSYTNRGDGSQNITGRKSNSGQKSGDRTTYNITNNYAARPAKKKTPPRNNTSKNKSFDTNKTPHLTNSPIINFGALDENIYQKSNMSFHTDNDKNKGPDISHSNSPIIYFGDLDQNAYQKSNMSFDTDNDTYKGPDISRSSIYSVPWSAGIPNFEFNGGVII